MLAERDGFSLRDRTIELSGVGNVGSRLQTGLKRWVSARCCTIRTRRTRGRG